MEVADVEERKMTYSWAEGDTLVFMDTKTGEQIHVEKDKVGDEARWLSEGLDVNVTLFNGNADRHRPAGRASSCRSSRASPASRATRRAARPSRPRLSTGAVVNVPLFIKEGEWIKVDTLHRASTSSA